MTQRKLRAIACLSTIILLNTGILTEAATPNSRQGDERLLEQALDTGIAMGIPGISVAIGVGNSVAWAGTAGYSDISRRIPVQINDRFGVGSITKTFVARVILQLVEEGRLDLDHTPQDYLDLEIVRAIPNTGIATLRQLLNHQSGIPTWEFQEDWIRNGRGDQMELGRVWGKTETLEYCTGDLLPATNEPGQQFAYSNTNYTLLGLIIEAVTGNDAAAEIRARLLEPLGLENTFLESFEDIPGGYVNHYHYATPHFQEVAGINRGFPEVRPYLVESTAGNLSPEWTAGGIVASASDLVRWAQAIRDGELLSPEMQREMFRYYPPREPSGGRSRFMQGLQLSEEYVDGYTIIGHGGATLGFSAAMYWLEDTDIVVILMVNVGQMHSGLTKSPIGIFLRDVWLPTVMTYLGR